MFSHFILNIWTSQKTLMNQQFTCGYTLLWPCAMMQSIRRDLAAETLTEPCWSDRSGLPLVFPTLWGKSNGSKEHNQPSHIKKKEKKNLWLENKVFSNFLCAALHDEKSHRVALQLLDFPWQVILGGAELSIWWSTAPSSGRVPQRSSQQ